MTLDVSRLSGWLNTDAYCRESKGRHTVRVAKCGSGGGRRWAGARSGQGCGLDCRLGAGHWKERTWNMPPMCVTLEVSKLSGWLNADAAYREPKGGHTMLGEVRVGRREGGG